MNTLRLADIIGTISATTCVNYTLPDILDNVGLLTFMGYSFGLIVITNKLNGIFRKGN